MVKTRSGWLQKASDEKSWLQGGVEKKRKRKQSPKLSKKRKPVLVEIEALIKKYKLRKYRREIIWNLLMVVEGARNAYLVYDNDDDPRIMELSKEFADSTPNITYAEQNEPETDDTVAINVVLVYRKDIITHAKANKAFHDAKVMGEVLGYECPEKGMGGDWSAEVYWGKDQVYAEMCHKKPILFHAKALKFAAAADAHNLKGRFEYMMRKD